MIMQIMVIIHSDKTIVCSMQNEILGIPHRSHKKKSYISTKPNSNFPCWIWIWKYRY